MQTTSQSVNIPDDFPHDTTLAVISGEQPKVCTILSKGKYIAGQPAAQHEERWRICEDLAHQLATEVLKHSTPRPTPTRVDTPTLWHFMFRSDTPLI